jgi:glycosyltransferase involved in cell wall biosynthesis
VRGPFKGPSGYDHHVREFVRELHRQGVALELIDLPEWSPAQLPGALRDPWYETLTQPVGARLSLQFCMPHQVVQYEGLLTVNYTMFEATRVPPGWVAANRLLDLLVLPTESSRRAWVASGMPAERIRICPLGINPDLFARPSEPMPLRLANGEPIDRYRVRFLNVSELGPRKNLVGLLRTWLRATGPDDNALLIVKLGRYAPGWLELFRDQIAEVEAQLGKRLEAAAPTHFVYDLFSDAEMPSLYAAATHYISLSHGEGWDQAMVEAAASGLKLIAPDHSAYQTYLDSSVARLVSSHEVPARFEGDPALQTLFAGANWWAPDEEQAASFIRLAIDGQNPDQASARERVLREFTWEQATRRLIGLLREVDRARPKRFWPLTSWLRGG